MENVVSYITVYGGDVLISLIMLFGLYISYSIRRPLVFRSKLSIVFILPLLLLAFSIGTPHHHAVKDTTMLIFSFLLMILYWREMKLISTSKGYHKNILSRLITEIPDFVWMKDLNLRFTYINKSAAKHLFKMDIDDILGKTCEEIEKIHNDNGIKFEFDSKCGNMDNNVLESKEAKISDECMDIDGKFVSLQIYNAPILNRHTGKIMGVIGVARDNTVNYTDHINIKNSIEEGDFEKAKELFYKHYRRNMCSGSACEVIYENTKN